jgi:hypothetical protein
VPADPPSPGAPPSSGPVPPALVAPAPSPAAPPEPSGTHFAFLHAPPVQGAPSFFAGLPQVPLVVSHSPDSWHSSLGGQSIAAPGTHTPAEHLSFWVQGLPSVQLPLVFVCTQPVAGSHVSFVHGLLSSQPSGVPPPHCPFVHFCAWRHLLPLSQAALSAALVFVQVPVPTLQPSVVHGFESLQFGPVVGVHTPAEQ